MPEIIGDLFAQLTILLRKEAQLARAEVSENMSGLASGLGVMVAGAVLLIPALVILLEAGVAALTVHGVASYWSALIVGGIVLIVGLILLSVGMGRLKPGNLVPHKTVRQLQRDAEVAREKARENNEPRRAA
jgi:hypothetical protein